jgi:hypothetical protein
MPVSVVLGGDVSRKVSIAALCEPPSAPDSVWLGRRSVRLHEHQPADCHCASSSCRPVSMPTGTCRSRACNCLDTYIAVDF